MTTAYDVKYLKDMVQGSEAQAPSWAETTLCLVVDSIEDYARERPLSFGLISFGIGFVLGWKLKFW
jgi:hypothetical protein